jgi:transposase
LPKIAAHVTEHQMVRVACTCRCTTKGPVPDEATAPACYGPGIRALAVYLSVYQHVPYDRLGQIVSDVLGIPVSVGAIAADHSIAPPSAPSSNMKPSEKLAELMRRLLEPA